MEVDLENRWVRALCGALVGAVCLKAATVLVRTAWSGSFTLVDPHVNLASEAIVIGHGAVIGALIWLWRPRIGWAALLLGGVWVLPQVVHLWRYIVTEDPWMYVRLLGMHAVASACAGALAAWLVRRWYVPPEPAPRRLRRPSRAA